MADASVSNTDERKLVWVRPPPPAPTPIVLKLVCNSIDAERASRLSLEVGPVVAVATRKSGHEQVGRDSTDALDIHLA